MRRVGSAKTEKLTCRESSADDTAAFLSVAVIVAGYNTRWFGQSVDPARVCGWGACPRCCCGGPRVGAVAEIGEEMGWSEWSFWLSTAMRLVAKEEFFSCTLVNGNRRWPCVVLGSMLQ